MKLIILATILAFLFTNFSHCRAIISEQIGVVTVPVADAAASEIGSEKAYSDLPYAAQAAMPCPRAHQLLFNETVIIKDTHQDEVLCKVFNTFYENKKQNKINTFWTHKKNITLLKDLSHKARATIPESYSKDLTTVSKLYNTAVLIEPWYDKVTQKTYSAGTRFVRMPQFDNTTQYAISLMCPRSHKAMITYIDKNFILTKYPGTKKQALRQFLSLIKQWVKASGIIPYVWGGCSYTQRLANNNFFALQKNNIIQYTRDQHNKPYTGFDCSGLILRAAQLCGMPYFYKNTSTLMQHLEPLNKDQVLEPGDLIAVPGHVLIVSDIHKNTAIEAKGYDAGYGKLQEIHLSDVFRSITSYPELIDAYYYKKPLEYLNQNKQVTQRISYVSLLKLSSIWRI